MSHLPKTRSLPSHSLIAGKSGYVQIINQDRLLQLAQEADGVLEVVRRPGTFVTCGCVLAVLWSATALPERLPNKVNSAFVLGPHRTMTQDAQFGFDQLVEVAARTLSPGINDPFTAIMCLDRIGEALANLAARPIPSAFRYDADGALRVIADSPCFADIADAAFDQIRQYGRGSCAVTLHLLETLESVTPQACTADRAALRRQADLIYTGRIALSAEGDRQRVAARYAQTVRALEEPPCLGLKANNHS